MENKIEIKEETDLSDLFFQNVRDIEKCHTDNGIDIKEELGEDEPPKCYRSLQNENSCLSLQFLAHSENSNDGETEHVNTLSTEGPSLLYLLLQKKNKQDNGPCITGVDDVPLLGPQRIHSSESNAASGHTRKEVEDNSDCAVDASELSERSHAEEYTAETSNSGQHSYKCNACQRCFSQLSNMKRHYSVCHEGSRPYSCDICAKSFKLKYHLKNHMLIHAAKRPHKCSLCEKTFYNKSNMKVHMKFHEKGRLYQCDLCDKNFYQKPHLRFHYLTHEKNIHKCESCDQSFRLTASLKKHYYLVHGGKNPYTCEICDCSFSGSSSLNQHNLIAHGGLKSYKCDICPRSFTHKNHLKMHSLFHQDSKEFKCDLCAKTFTSEPQLQEHMLVHEGVKPCNHIVIEETKYE